MFGRLNIQGKCTFGFIHGAEFKSYEAGLICCISVGLSNIQYEYTLGGPDGLIKKS